MYEHNDSVGLSSKMFCGIFFFFVVVYHRLCYVLGLHVRDTDFAGTLLGSDQ